MSGRILIAVKEKETPEVKAVFWEKIKKFLIYIQLS